VDALALVVIGLQPRPRHASSASSARHAVKSFFWQPLGLGVRAPLDRLERLALHLELGAQRGGRARGAHPRLRAAVEAADG